MTISTRDTLIWSRAGFDHRSDSFIYQSETELGALQLRKGTTYASTGRELKTPYWHLRLDDRTIVGSNVCKTLTEAKTRAEQWLAAQRRHHDRPIQFVNPVADSETAWL